MTFYFDFSTWWRMLRLVRRDPDPNQRRSLYLTLLGVVPALATLHAICFALDPILYPRLRETEVREPVFIVGHARSGTTLLHRIMAEDPGRFSFFRLYEMFLPSLLEKKLVRFVGRVDAALLRGAIRRRVANWDEKKFRSTQGIHATGLWAPEEDDFILTLSCYSGFWIVLLPFMGELDFYHLDKRPPRVRRRIMRFYKECVRRQLYLNGPEKTHLSKNPTFCGRVESIIETFPDARFVVPVRDPLATIPSLLKLLHLSWTSRDREPEQIRRSLRVLADQSFHSYTYPLEVLERHPETRSLVVDYRNLVAEPMATVEATYKALGLPMSAAFGEVLQREQARTTEHESTHRYSLEEYGLDPDEITTRLAPLYEQYGWDTEGARNDDD